MNRPQKLFLAAGLPAIAVLATWLAAPAAEAPNAWVRAFALLWAAVALTWLLRVLMRRLLWRVSRR
ncbi:MAG: hypothetical protein MI919_17390, partial [Holophagales bacterium]|nr:hypothetical protein [Holophagales bacterium]